MYFHMIRVKMRGNVRFLSNIQFCCLSFSKNASFGTQQGLTWVRISLFSPTFFTFFYFQLVLSSKLGFILTVEIVNSKFLGDIFHVAQPYVHRYGSITYPDRHVRIWNWSQLLELSKRRLSWWSASFWQLSMISNTSPLVIPRLTPTREVHWRLKLNSVK